MSTVCLVVGAFRHEAGQAATLAELADRLNDAITREKDPGNPDHVESFVTALLVEIRPGATEASLLSRGHTAPYLLNDGHVAMVEPKTPGLPLGMDLPTVDGTTRPDTVALPLDATLLLVTDGITEARDRNGTFYDPRAALARIRPSTPRELVDALTRSVTYWTGGRRQDDIAVLALKPVPRAPELLGRA
ncbi:serine/threonine-protein phosphatase [Actinoallomurus sp. WRP6H-15]|nr:serine/threonine-protein phosphatase [Actinoallomurus soli]